MLSQKQFTRKFSKPDNESPKVNTNLFAIALRCDKLNKTNPAT